MKFQNAKRGPKPVFGETRTEQVKLLFTPEQKELIKSVGGNATVMAKWVLERAITERAAK